jgi:hypothetical protein
LLADTYYFLGDSEQLRDSPGRVMGAWDAQRPGYLKVRMPPQSGGDLGFALRCDHPSLRNCFFHHLQLCGMLAFGAQECRQMALAEEQGMRALSDDMEDAWARELFLLRGRPSLARLARLVRLLGASAAVSTRARCVFVLCSTSQCTP